MALRRYPGFYHLDRQSEPEFFKLGILEVLTKRVVLLTRTEGPTMVSRSLQLRVFGLGLLQDGDVGVGIFP